MIVIVLISVDIVGSTFHSARASLRMDRSRLADMTGNLQDPKLACNMNGDSRLGRSAMFFELLESENGVKLKELEHLYLGMFHKIQASEGTRAVKHLGTHRNR
jgi:hypothetical protein